MSFKPLGSVVEYISLRNPDLQLDVSRIEHFCFLVFRNYGRFDCFIPSRERLSISCGKAKVPCNLYKIVSLGSACSVRQPSFYESASGEIVFTDARVSDGTVVVDMLLFPLDEDGRLLIEEEYIPACYWYIISQVDIDPMMKGDLPERMFDRAEAKFMEEVARARGSMTNITDGQFNAAIRSLHSWRTLRKPRNHR